MSLIQAMSCDEGVPDDIYLSALINARTPEEIAFRDVLVFHRDVLNGGLDQALENRNRLFSRTSRLEPILPQGTREPISC